MCERERERERERVTETDRQTERFIQASEDSIQIACILFQNAVNANIQENDPNVIKASNVDRMRDYGDVLANFRCTDR